MAFKFDRIQAVEDFMTAQGSSNPALDLVFISVTIYSEDK